MVFEAGDSASAVNLAIKEQPDLMLLDINLPDRTGWDVLRELRSQGNEVPTIVVSAVRVSSGRLAEFNLVAYLPKPFPLETLLRLIGGENDSFDAASESNSG
jgi:DNA-binding response OmpR family regulator